MGLLGGILAGLESWWVWKMLSAEVDVPFNELFIQAYPRIVGFFKRYPRNSAEDSRDLAQETFLRLYRKWRNEGTEKVLSERLLITIALNIQRNRLREFAGPRHPIGQIPLEDVHAATGPGPVKETLDRESLELTRLALKELSERQRQTLLLQVQGHSLDEISRILQIKPGSVGHHIFQARKKLKDALGALSPWVTGDSS